MGLVILAALFGASIFLLFRLLDARNVELLPAIAVNYLMAFILGTAHTPVWRSNGIEDLWWPSLFVGLLFIGVFLLTGLSSQRAGVAVSTVASKLSLILTVVFAVLVHGEDPGLLGWAGICIALIAVVTSVGNDAGIRSKSDRLLPVLLFFGTAAIDISLNAVQRAYLTSGTEAVFPTLCFIPAGAIAFLIVALRGRNEALLSARTWGWGTVLGVLNFVSLLFVVRALARSGMPATRVFPLISIGVILFGTAGTIVLFKERLRSRQIVGIGLSVISLVLLILADG
ncbi:MAG: DMT family transporter [Flavobacteriales bacterium]|nr:DMT family transporter [Flavobacteriales bacterium]